MEDILFLELSIDDKIDTVSENMDIIDRFTDDDVDLFVSEEEDVW